MPQPIDHDNTRNVYIPKPKTTGSTEKTFESTKTNTTNKTGGNATSTTSSTIDSVTPSKPAAPIFSTKNLQSDGNSKLKRMEFVFNNHYYRFALNPEEYTQEEPNRISVTQTKGGAFIDDFGGGVQTISFKGTTGFKNGTRNPDNGFNKFKELRDMIRKYYFDVAPGSTLTEAKELQFRNYTDGEHWIVVPRVFKLLRSTSRPLLYLYEVQLVCVRSIGTPASKDSSAKVDSLAKVEVGK